MNRRFLWPRLGRRGKVVRNLLLCLVLLLLLWGEFAYPLPTREMNFRRMEGYYLLPRGEIILREGDLFVDVGEGQAVVGRVPTRSRPTWGGYHTSDLWVCSLGEGPSPVSLSDSQVLFLQLPQDAVRGELTICSGQGKQTAWAQTEEGRCRFVFENDMQANCTSYTRHCGVEGWPYVLRLYNGSGEPILEQTGEIPLFPHRQELAHYYDDCYNNNAG